VSKYIKFIFSVFVFAVFAIGIDSTYQYHSSQNDPWLLQKYRLLTMTPFELGQYYFNHGDSADGTYDLQKARLYFEEAIKEGPKSNNLLWYQLGRIDFLEGKFDDAINKFNRQIEYFGDQYSNVYYMLGLTYGYKARKTGNEEDWRHAEENFHTYLKYDPLSPWARVDLAWVYFSQGKYEEMKPILENGLESMPQNPWLLNMYGLSLLNLGNKAKAREVFFRAQAEAQRLTTSDWGLVYPGNNPSFWKQGIEEFRSLIDKNLALTN
jgi:tetratricopeptide (TPR) repeat protein